MPRRRVRAHGDPAHEPAARPQREGHRAEHARRHRAQAVRGAAGAPGVPRLGHRAREPRAVPRPREHALERQTREHEADRRCCSWTSTTSRRSTTRSGTPPATSCSCEVGERLKGVLRAADTAARLGGDEFAILLEDGGGGHRRRPTSPSGSCSCWRSRSRSRARRSSSRRQHRHRRPPTAERDGERRGAAAQRRRGDVHGEGARQGPLPGLRAARCTTRRSSGWS